MNRKDYEKAIEREVEEWPGVTVEFVEGSKHPKAKFAFAGKMLAHAYAGTPSDSAFGVHQMLGDMRRTMKKLGAARAKPEPTKEEDEAPYRKPNDGAARREPIRVSDPAKPQPDVADQMVGIGAATPDQAKAAKPVTPTFVFEPEPGDEESTRDAAAALREEIEARIAAITDGIYFDLPADVYHAVPRLSSSGIQKLCVSPATFWRGSWLDPGRAEEEEETIWLLLGRAYHTARLEPHLFESTYVRELEKSAMPPGSLFTGTEMGRALEEFGAKKSGSVAEQAERLADCGFPTDKLWHFAKQAWERDRRGRSAIPAKHYDAMITDMERIRANAQIAPLLSGGEAEVSVFWTDEYGVQMKARIDYLTRDWWVDFKTFDNSRGKHLNQALSDAFRYNRYYVQGVVYREAVEQIRTEGLQIIEAATDDQRALVAALQIKPGELRCWYVFQEKNGIPNLIGREYPFYAVPYTTLFNEQITDDMARREAVREATKQRTQIHTLGQHEVLNSKKLFVLYSQVYQPGEPWFPLDAIGSFSDEDFHPYWLSGDMK